MNGGNKMKNNAFASMMDSLIERLKDQGKNLKDDEKIVVEESIAELERYKTMEPQEVIKVISAKMAELTEKLSTKKE